MIRGRPILRKILVLLVETVFFNWTLNVSRTASYEITLVCLSVRPFITKFFSRLDNQTLDNCIMISKYGRSQIFEKKENWRTEFGRVGPKSDQKLGGFFWPFSQVWFFSFPSNCIQW